MVLLKRRDVLLRGREVLLDWWWWKVVWRRMLLSSRWKMVLLRDVLWKYVLRRRNMLRRNVLRRGRNMLKRRRREVGGREELLCIRREVLRCHHVWGKGLGNVARLLGLLLLALLRLVLFKQS